MRANELEEQERQNYMEARHKKILAAEAKLMQKQQNEMNALKKKLEARMNERLKLREVEHNKILQRYQNIKKEIESKQTLEKNVKERQYNTRPSTASSRSVMASKSKMQASRMGKASSNGARK